MALDLLNPLDRTSSTFRADVDALFSGGLNAMISQINAALANVSSIAAGGAYAFPYTFDSSTANADPGPGKLRLNSSGQSGSTSCFIDPEILGGANIDSLLASLGTGTSVIKAALRIVKAADPSKWLLFDVSNIGASSGYRTMSLVARAGSSTAPFENGDTVMAFIDRVGDVGFNPAAYVLLGSAVISSPVASIDFLGVITASYPTVEIEMAGIFTSGVDLVRAQMVTGVSTTVTTGYFAGVTSGSNNNTIGTHFPITDTSNTRQMNATIKLRGNRSSSLRKSVSFSGTSGTAAGSNPAAVNSEGYLEAGQTITGIRLYTQNGSTFTAGIVNIYGKAAA